MTDAESAMQHMIDDLDLPLPDPEANLQLLADVALMNRFNELTQELLQMGEALTPKTQTGRDLHSTRSACLIEMRRRRIR